MTKKTKSNLVRKILKMVGIGLGCIFGLFLIASFLLLTLLEPYANRFLKKKVSENTEGLYSLEFEEIDINLLTGTIQLQEVHFKPDSLVYRQLREAGEAGKTTVDIKTTNLKISGIGLLDIAFRNRLNITTLFMEQPEITTITDNNQEDEIEKKEKDQNILENLNAINIGEVNIPKAYYTHFILEGQNKILIHELPLFSLYIQDFELDAERIPGQPVSFQVGDFQVIAEAYKYTSPNHLYNISFKQFSYSLTSGDLLGKNIDIEVDSTFLTSNPGQVSTINFDLKVPSIRMTSLNLLEVYKSQKITMDHFTLDNINLNIINDPGLASSKDSIDLEVLYKDLSEHLKVIRIKKFQLLNANVTYQSQYEQLHKIHEFNQIDLELLSLNVDSATLFSPRKEFFVEDLQFRAGTYLFRNPTNPYNITLKRLHFSTLSESLKIDSIEVLGDLSRNRELRKLNKAQDDLINFKASNFELIGFNPIKAYKSKTLDIGSLIIENGHLDLFTNEPSGQVNPGVSDKENINEISDYIAAVNIKEINLKDISFIHYETGKTVKQVQEITHASLLLSEIYIDSAFFQHSTPDIPVENLELNVYQYTHWLADYTLSLNNIQYSTHSQRLSAKKLNFQPKLNIRNEIASIKINQRSVYDLSARQIQIFGLNLFEIFNDNKLEVDQVLLRQPDGTIVLNQNFQETGNELDQPANSQKLFNFINSILVKKFTLSDGSLAYNQLRDEEIRIQKLETVSATILNFNLNQKTLSKIDEKIPMEEMVLTAREYSYQSPDKLYQLLIDQLQYSSLSQILNAHSIKINSDKDEHEAIKAREISKANRNLFDISAQKFQVKGLDLIRTFETGYFQLEQIILSEPEVAILQDQNVPFSEPETVTEDELPAGEEVLDQVSEVVESFRVNNIQLKEGIFILNILKDTITRSQTLEHVSLSIEQLRLVSLDAPDIVEMFDMDDFQVMVRDYNYILPDSLYTFEVAELRSSLQNQTLTIDSLRLTPLFNKEEFSDNLEYVQDRFDILVPDIEMEGINLRTLFNNQNFDIENILVKNSELDIYRDNRLERDPDRRPQTLQNMLRQIDNSIIVDSLVLDGGKLTYSELPPDREDPIALIMENLHLQISNITNDTTLISENNTVNIQAKTQFMGESKLFADLELHLNHPEDLYSYEGTLESMDFDAFNSLFENLLFIRITDGQINKIEFSVQATEHLAEGSMNFFYNDLNIKFIDRKNPGNPRLRHRVGSWLVNNLLIKSNNPSKRGKFREGDIKAERDYQRSVFNHMAAAMMDGIASSLMPPLVETIFNVFAGD